MSSPRNLSQEHADNQRRYAYDFDTVLRRYMLQTFAPLLAGRATALELGCYRGDMTALLVDHFQKLEVVEGAPDLAKEVQARFGDRVTVHCQRFEDAQLDKTYDAIFLVHTLEHLDDPIGVLRRCLGWLSKGGILFVVVPNANAPSRQLAVKMGLIDSNTAVTPAEFEHGHRRTYTLDTLERDTRAAGLEVIGRGGVFFKALANFQFDSLLAQEKPIIDSRYLDACHALGMQYPDLCASIYNICAAPTAR